jgi:hypothetical protein
MKYRNFSVTAGLRGFKVAIGCKEAYFSTVTEMEKAIHDYLENPEETEKKFLEGDQGDVSESANSAWVNTTFTRKD